MARKCSVCGGKLNNNICCECGMDHSHIYSGASGEPPAVNIAEGTEQAARPDMLNEENDPAAVKNKSFLKTWIVIVLSLCIIGAIAVFLIKTVGTESARQKRQRAIERRREQQITARINIPEIEIPTVRMPKVTVPDIDFFAWGDRIQDAVERDRKKLEEQNKQIKGAEE